ncbi:MbtH family protein [Streptosporangium sandarakinum]|uniref:MbtH protein n=1 Tax=Streptosporangium sandarakinum TaxID=1260955 RepID=A0A852VA19_9ACTN|nr:MbtH family protein [Streptosporangium sandarakinum]NYF44338.1 MbtH protein [Streptosporangium sandarakinum]
MSNPFDDENGSYLVLVNGEGQYSLWPTSAEVPGGWDIAHETDSRQGCLDFINANWADMRPRSLQTS